MTTRRRMVMMVLGLALAMPSACASAADPAGGGDGGGDGVHGGADGGVDGGADPTPGPAVLVVPAALDLGAADCGGVATTTFEVANHGGRELRFALLTPDPKVALVPVSGAVAPGGAVTVRLTADVPSSVDAGAALSTTFMVTTDVGPAQAIPVSLRARGAQLVLEPAAIGFGQVPVGAPSVQPFRIRNAGDATASVVVAAPGGEFALSGAASGTVSLAPGGSTSGELRYLPANLGGDSAAAPVVVHGAVCGAASPPASLALALSGAGVVGDGVMVQGGPVDFGVVSCGVATTAPPIRLVNPTAIPAPFQARLLDDPEQDHLYFSVSPESGSVPPNGSIELRVRRAAVTAPSAVGVHAAVLQISTTLGLETVTELPVRDDVRTARLQLATGRTDFGFALVGEAPVLPIEIHNRGDAPAFLRGKVGAPFEVALPLPIAPGATATALVTYRPTAATLGPRNALVELSAAGACEAPSEALLQAGRGPKARLTELRIGHKEHCPLPARLTRTMFVLNQGNEPLKIQCRVAGASELALELSPTTMQTAAPGASAAFQVSYATGDTYTGTASGMLECFVNEVGSQVRRIPVTRTYQPDSDLCVISP